MSGAWIYTEAVKGTNSPPESGLYWVIIMGDSEVDGPHVYYEFDDYIVLMNVTVEDDGPDNPPYVNGTADHDEDWDLVSAFWSSPVFKPEMPK